MRIRFDCAITLLFPLGFTLTKIPFFYFKTYSGLIYDERRNVYFFLNELIPLLLWCVFAAISKYKEKGLSKETDESIVSMHKMVIIKPEKPYNRYFHVFLMSMCGLITFGESFIYISELFTFTAMGATFLFSIIFTKLMLKSKWFRHQWVGFSLIFLFMILNLCLLIFFPTSIHFYTPFLLHQHYSSLAFVVLIPIRDIIEKWLIDKHFVDLYYVLAFENLFAVFGSGVYVIISLVRSVIIVKATSEIIWVIIGYIISSSANQYLRMKTIQVYNPNYKYIGDSIIFIIVILILNNLQAMELFAIIKRFYRVVIPVFVVYLFGSFLFAELIIIYSCGLEINTKKEIAQRSQDESNKDILNLIELDSLNSDNELHN